MSLLGLEWGELRLTFEATVLEVKQEEFETFLIHKIREFNNEHSRFHREARKPGSLKPINIILENEAGAPIGGLAASTYWDWLEIDNLYIPEELRGQGIGVRLLKQAEEIAIGRGCRRAFLTTFEFQARGFYEKQGYYVTGKLEDYPPKSTYYWMRKDLIGKP